MSNARFEFQENHYYHIYNRWFWKQTLFFNKHDFDRFYMYIIKELSLHKTIKLIAYSFLPNHFHFIIHNLETGLQISDFMRKVQVSYAMYFKKRYETGLLLRAPVFEGRFKTKTIKTEDYLSKCLAYVSYNAVKHGIVENIKDYPYTSYHQLEDKSWIHQYKDLILGELEI